MVNKLFVYGTLGPGRPNEHILGDIGGEWAVASVRGSLHDEGWGAELGFPGIVLAADGGRVDGFLFESDRLDQHWPRLDAFEGEAYQRVLAEVELEDTSTVTAYVYTLKSVAG